MAQPVMTSAAGAVLASHLVMWVQSPRVWEVMELKEAPVLEGKVEPMLGERVPIFKRSLSEASCPENVMPASCPENALAFPAATISGFLFASLQGC